MDNEDKSKHGLQKMSRIHGVGIGLKGGDLFFLIAPNNELKIE